MINIIQHEIGFQCNEMLQKDFSVGNLEDAVEMLNANQPLTIQKIFYLIYSPTEAATLVQLKPRNQNNIHRNYRKVQLAWISFETKLLLFKSV